MHKTLSKDGTPIAYDRSGSGPPLIVVDGALCYRASGPSGPMAEALAEHFSVITYDRRGRGDSGDKAPYAIEREIEDIEALIREAGGTAFVYGVSSGAALALEAANCGLPITRLAVYEAPFIVDDSRPPLPEDFRAQLDEAISTGRRGDAVRLFMKFVGVPGIFVTLMRFMPAWSRLTAVAHTLPYDITLVEDNERGRPLRPKQWSRTTTPTLVMDGGKSPAWMRSAMKSLADVLPNAKYRTLDGQTHIIKARAHVAPLVEFFKH
jgi:pimeloyl-ACP methyl ester carboxylesterase